MFSLKVALLFFILAAATFYWPLRRYFSHGDPVFQTLRKMWPEKDTWRHRMLRRFLLYLGLLSACIAIIAMLRLVPQEYRAAGPIDTFLILVASTGVTLSLLLFLEIIFFALEALVSRWFTTLVAWIRILRKIVVVLVAVIALRGLVAFYIVNSHYAAAPSWLVALAYYVPWDKNWHLRRFDGVPAD